MLSDQMKEQLLKVLVTREELQARIKEMGAQITADYTDEDDIVMIGILKGAVPFFAELAFAIDRRVKMDFMSISSYGDALKTSGIVRIAKDVDTSITGKHVIIAEDIMDSGLTLNYLTHLLRERQPASIRIACMLDKPSRRQCDITPDYVGFEIPDEFVVGYGLDCAGELRNLPYVGVLKPEAYPKD